MSQIDSIRSHLQQTILFLRSVDIEPIASTRIDSIKNPTDKGLSLVKKRGKDTQEEIVKILNKLEALSSNVQHTISFMHYLHHRRRH
jgi:peptidoglycan hydrolase CwlO-like protein